jgi:hypothetical protein
VGLVFGGCVAPRLTQLLHNATFFGLLIGVALMEIEILWIAITVTA